MCRECSDSSGDPRAAAFQPFLVVEAIPVSELKRVEAGGPGFITQIVVTSPQEAEAQAAHILEKGPAAVRVLPVALCLN